MNYDFGVATVYADIMIQSHERQKKIIRGSGNACYKLLLKTVCTKWVPAIDFGSPD